MAGESPPWHPARRTRASDILGNAWNCFLRTRILLTHLFPGDATILPDSAVAVGQVFPEFPVDEYLIGLSGTE
jgi:hypothetical protein